MALATRVLALLEQLTREDIEGLPPAERQRLAQLLRHLAGFADPPSPAGVLSDLKNRPRDC